LQELDLFRRRRAAESRVAVRIAAEAADDRCMLLGPFEGGAIAGIAREPGEERDRSILDCRSSECSNGR
jgi:hypothetical protein